MDHPPEYPAVTVFIPTWNDAQDLAACLDSLCAIDYPRSQVEIVIWDNASQDDTATVVDAKFSQMRPQGWLALKYLTAERNVGSYIPYNLARESFANTQYILGLDADVQLRPNMLRALVDAAHDDRVAVVGARSVYTGLPRLTAHGAGLVSRWTGKYSEVDAKERIECEYVIGCAWLLNRRAFDHMGGFDPDFFINHWEVEYCLRAIMLGYVVRYEPLAVVFHKIAPGGTSRPDRLYYNYRNKLLLIRKSKFFPWPTLTLCGVAFMALARILVTAGVNGQGDRLVRSLQGLLHGLLDQRGEAPCCSANR